MADGLPGSGVPSQLFTALQIEGLAAKSFVAGRRSSEWQASRPTHANEKRFGLRYNCNDSYNGSLVRLDEPLVCPVSGLCVSLQPT